MGCVDGVTQPLAAGQVGRPLEEIKEICGIVDGPTRRGVVTWRSAGERPDPRRSPQRGGEVMGWRMKA
jgi:hypothetical protein